MREDLRGLEIALEELRVATAERDVAVSENQALNDALHRANQMRFTELHAAQSINDGTRSRLARALTELSLAQKGRGSGCGCPIGDCQKRLGLGEACWKQWAEKFIAGRIRDIGSDAVERYKNHPTTIHALRKAVSDEIARRAKP